jgi:hypothetical protein
MSRSRCDSKGRVTDYFCIADYSTTRPNPSNTSGQAADLAYFDDETDSRKTTMSESVRERRTPSVLPSGDQ